MKKVIKLTESDLHRIVKESVTKILREDYYSMNKPYGKRKLSDYSSDETKALNDYDKGFGMWKKLQFSGDKNVKPTYEPAPIGNYPDEHLFPEDDQPYQYWNSLRDYEDRMPIDPSPEDKAYQTKRDWHDIDFASNWDDFSYADEHDTDYNYNVHNNAFDASGANGRVGRLNSFDDDVKGRKAKRFNGTMRSLKR